MRDDVVVVGLDGSSNAKRALGVGIEEARVRGWSLRLVNAYPIPGGVPVKDARAPGYPISLWAVVAPAIDEMADDARRHGVDVETRFRPGEPAGVLVDASYDAGLVVIGSRGKGGFFGRLLGSVASTVPAYAGCPVIVVPCRDTETGRDITRNSRTADPALDYTGRVVVGVDVLGPSNSALVEAAALADIRGLPLLVVGVIGSDERSYEWIGAAAEGQPTTIQVQRTLDDCLAAVTSEYPGIATGSGIHEGPPAKLLAEISATANIVVVGSRGRGGFAGLVLGSTSQGLLHHATGPVMVVRNTPGTRGLSYRTPDRRS